MTKVTRGLGFSLSLTSPLLDPVGRPPKEPSAGYATPFDSRLDASGYLVSKTSSVTSELVLGALSGPAGPVMPRLRHPVRAVITSSGQLARAACGVAPAARSALEAPGHTAGNRSRVRNVTPHVDDGRRDLGGESEKR